MKMGGKSRLSDYGSRVIQTAKIGALILSIIYMMSRWKLPSDKVRIDDAAPIDPIYNAAKQPYREDSAPPEE